MTSRAARQTTFTIGHVSAFLPIFCHRIQQQLCQNRLGIFTLNKVPQEHEKPLLLIEAPRMLFPFARNVLAETTRDGGYPPLMLNPIDFASLFHKQAEKQKAEIQKKEKN